MQIRNHAGAYPRWAQRISRGDGPESVRCRIRGKHLRVISFRHLSKHEIDRDTYIIEEYRRANDPQEIIWHMAADLARPYRAVAAI